MSTLSVATLIPPLFWGGAKAKALQRGLTLEMQRDQLFHFYKRWDDLFGGRMNLNPAGTIEAGDDDDDDVFAEDPQHGPVESDNDEQFVVFGRVLDP